MFLEKLTDAQIEEFAGNKIFGKLNLEATSLGQTDEKLLLIRTMKNRSIVRHYVSDVVWYNCENGVDDVKNLSRKWQGYIMSCLSNFEDKKAYAEYLRAYYESDKKTKSKAERILSEVFEQADVYDGNKCSILEV